MIKTICNKRTIYRLSIYLVFIESVKTTMSSIALYRANSKLSIIYKHYLRASILYIFT